MARRLHVYPKAQIDGSDWTLVVKVYDLDTKVQSRFLHDVPAGVTVTPGSRLLKLTFDLTVPDGTPDSAIDDALFVLDIKPGGGSATVWENWQTRAETIISRMVPGFTTKEFWAEWSHQDTSKVRNDARRALVTLQSGWTIDVGSIHQHEGDNTVTEA